MRLLLLPDFNSVKRDIRRNAFRYLERLVNSDELLAGLKSERHFEGSRVSSYAGASELPYVEEVTSFTINRDALIEKGAVETIEILKQVAERIKEQRIKFLLRRVGEESDRDGTSVHVEHGPITPDAFLTALERLRIDFDDSGVPQLPTLVAHPGMADALRALDDDVEFKQQFDAVIDRKRQEWNDRESRRKLVD